MGDSLNLNPTEAWKPPGGVRKAFLFIQIKKRLNRVINTVWQHLYRKLLQQHFKKLIFLANSAAEVQTKRFPSKLWQKFKIHSVGYKLQKIIWDPILFRGLDQPRLDYWRQSRYIMNLFVIKTLLTLQNWNRKRQRRNRRIVPSFLFLFVGWSLQSFCHCGRHRCLPIQRKRKRWFQTVTHQKWQTPAGRVGGGKQHYWAVR